MRSIIFVSTAIALSPHTAAAADDKPSSSCLTFLSRYEACVRDHVPAPQQPQIIAHIEQMRFSLADASRTEEGKANFTAGCRSMEERIAPRLEAMGCNEQAK